uniref:UBP-type domain-containing protein n=1 Tax=Meloidogyne javanica TaxID=6303 RepID=A0A915N261_MELJA
MQTLGAQTRQFPNLAAELVIILAETVKKDSKLPSDGLNTKAACNKCSNTGENWVCLKCFEVYCSRYVEGHALAHTEETKHPLALSFADFSVWCYPCNSYIDNKVFDEAKEAAIKSKFGGKTEG